MNYQIKKVVKFNGGYNVLTSGGVFTVTKAVRVGDSISVQEGNGLSIGDIMIYTSKRHVQMERIIGVRKDVIEDDDYLVHTVGGKSLPLTSTVAPVEGDYIIMQENVQWTVARKVAKLLTKKQFADEEWRQAGL